LTLTYDLETFLPFRLTRHPDTPRSKRCGEGKTTLSLRQGASGALNVWKTKIDGRMQVRAAVGKVCKLFLQSIVVSIEQCCIQFAYLLKITFIGLFLLIN